MADETLAKALMPESSKESRQHSVANGLTRWVRWKLTPRTGVHCTHLQWARREVGNPMVRLARISRTR